ncbi:MAG: hypothetical protein COA43_11090 [Robiginitomaculum sp.]|nr:MAG: hypothetical protein COA43_11090 [Robiginitomaculum sp.]
MSNRENSLVKIIADEDGEVIENPKWHLAWNYAGSPAAFCTGEVFGYGEGNAVFEQKNGRITCPLCLDMVRSIKAVKL